jgi:hypothetical protein
MTDLSGENVLLAFLVVVALVVLYLIGASFHDQRADERHRKQQREHR